MRTLATALAVCAVLCTVAAANPSGDDWVYLTFDQNGDPNHNEITPAPYSTVNCFLVAELIMYGLEGFTTMSFRLSNPVLEYPGVVATADFVNLLPGGLAIGSWDTGLTVASTECLSNYPVTVGYLSCFYLGGNCSLRILDHPDYPKWVVDCQDPGHVLYYVVLNDAYIQAGSPVEDVSWAAVKSLYR